MHIVWSRFVAHFVLILVANAWAAKRAHPTPEKHLLLKRMKRIPIAQDRQPQGCGCRAYMDVFTACLEQRVAFSSILLVTC
jgi:hypothetical protein